MEFLLAAIPLSCSRRGDSNSTNLPAQSFMKCKPFATQHEKRHLQDGRCFLTTTIENWHEAVTIG